MGVPAAQVFKTLVVTRPPQKPMLVMIPADRQLDLKKLAKAVGEKKVKMAGHSEAELLTGLQVGGISALALTNKGFAVFLDKSAESFDQIYVSAGQRGLDIQLTVKDLVKITRARLVEVT
jgi:Cys-tRNA(Pro)/Cys-tRNA(Cys) deacylase